VKVFPGDDLDRVMESVDALAAELGFEPLCDEDRRLVRHVARRSWSNFAIAQREDDWLAADKANSEHGIDPAVARELVVVNQLAEAANFHTPRSIN
jgi:hypothetical protein